MKYNILLFAALFVYAFISAQTGAVSFSGKLHDAGKMPVIHIQNIDGVNISVPVKAQSSFSFVTDSLQKGFYSVDGIGTAYLCPGYALNVQPEKDGSYFFSGKGALENNALRMARKQLSAFFSVNATGELNDAAYFLDMPVFLQKLDSFQHAGELLFNTSSDAFFSKYAALDLSFYEKHLLSLYTLYYGIGKEELDKVYRSIDTMDRTSPHYMMNSLAATTSAHQKTMRWQDMQKIMDLIYIKWDKNNDTLFRNGAYYREAMNDYLRHMAYDKKYYKYRHFPLKPADRNITALAVAREELSNPYMLLYYEYTITSDLLKETKDTAVLNKYYNEFTSRCARRDYLSDIKEIYNNAILYADNAPAPAFLYKDVSGKTVSLESLRGKFVYIDVWATWCGPCKAEIPHLKEIEAAYNGKNLEFVSISVDEQQDENKWKTFVIKNELKGIQLMSDHAFESAFIRKMNINAIPRFVLIDPAGKIVSANAARPSDKSLRNILDKLP